MAKHWWTRAVVGRTLVSDPLQDADRPDARFEAEWRPLVKTRLLIVLGCLGLWAVGVEAQLVRLQVYKHNDFVDAARARQDRFTYPEALRGDIVDRNHQLLAYSVESFDLYANPALVKDPAGEARELCQALGDCAADEQAQVTAKLRKVNKAGKPLQEVLLRDAGGMSPDAVMRVRALIAERAERARAAKATAPATLRLERRTWRYYPQRELASQVVGFVRADGKGGGGAESRFDGALSGVAGRKLAQIDGKTHEMFTRVEREPTPGDTLELTIDVGLQHIAERELRAGVEASGASGGSVIVMDPATGEIFAQASYPTYNPNAYGDYSDDERRNRSVQDTYEPGSTFKIVTASAAINEGILTPNQMIDCNPGFITVPGRSKPIPEAEGHNYGVLSLEDVLVKSSNVGAIKIGRQVGVERMMQYVRRFPFLQTIAPDFAGESRGRAGTAGRLGESGLASISMGYEIGVTPLQMAAAASVVANGGLLVEPHVVRATIHNGQRKERTPTVLRRVIEPGTALAMTTIMEDVVQRGTGQPAALDRYQVAGKTGTASKVVNGQYSKTDYNVSFDGFVPSRRPAFTILVVVDTPRNGPAYGSAVAAPIFKRIAEAALQYKGVLPSINPAPPVIVASDRNVLPRPPGRPAASAPALVNVGGRPAMPDVRGLTLREALRRTQSLGLAAPSTDGDGVVVFQSPAPGAAIAPSDRITLHLRREPATTGGGDR